MKVTILDSNHVKLVDMSEPVCCEGGIIVKLMACGICGSDLTNIFSLSCKPSQKLGHEISGIISEISPNVKNYKVGDRVIIHHHSSCGNCYYCNHGNDTMCPQFTTQIEPCGLSEQILVSKWIVEQGGVIKIPYSISFEEATLIEPLACCIRAWKKISFVKDDSVAIFGFGPIGALHALIAQNLGLKKIFCIDKDRTRLNFCKSYKIGKSLMSNDKNLQKNILKETNDIGIDIVIIATADLSTITKALKIIRKGGIIMVFGEPTNNQSVNIDVSKFYSNEISILTSYAATNEDMKNALGLVENKIIDISKLITHRFSIIQVSEAINFAKFGINRMKVVIK